MHSRKLAVGLSALAALAFVAGTASAGDIVRLSLPGGQSAPTLDLKATPDDLAADTVPTRLVRGAARGVARGVGFAAHRGYYGGYRGGFYGGYRGYYGGYRGYYGGYRGYYGGYYAPRFYGAYYGPRYYGSYYYTPSYYDYPSYSGYYAPLVTYPIASAGAVVAAQPAVIRSAAPANYERPLPMPQADDQPQPAPGQPGTYDYDGGPQRRIPMPPAEESPVVHPNRHQPAVVEDLVVKLPGKASGKWTYPAYGEKPSR
jgi:hypothetical protein